MVAGAKVLAGKDQSIAGKCRCVADSGADTRRGGTTAQSEHQPLEHERRDPPGAGAAVVRGVRKDRLVPGPGQRDVEPVEAAR